MMKGGNTMFWLWFWTNAMLMTDEEWENITDDTEYFAALSPVNYIAELEETTK
jgi:hypothetical protein